MLTLTSFLTPNFCFLTSDAGTIPEVSIFCRIRFCILIRLFHFFFFFNNVYANWLNVCLQLQSTYVCATFKVECWKTEGLKQLYWPSRYWFHATLNVELSFTFHKTLNNPGETPPWSWCSQLNNRGKLLCSNLFFKLTLPLVLTFNKLQ